MGRSNGVLATARRDGGGPRECRDLTVARANLARARPGHHHSRSANNTLAPVAATGRRRAAPLCLEEAPDQRRCVRPAPAVVSHGRIAAAPGMLDMRDLAQPHHGAAVLQHVDPAIGFVRAQPQYALDRNILGCRPLSRRNWSNSWRALRGATAGSSWPCRMMAGMPRRSAAGLATLSSSGRRGSAPGAWFAGPRRHQRASPVTGPECMASAATSCGCRSATRAAMPAPADRPAMYARVGSRP